MRREAAIRPYRQIGAPWALVFVVLFCLGGPSAIAEPLPIVRIGVLKFGTVNWEIDIVRRHRLDRANGFVLEPTELVG